MLGGVGTGEEFRIANFGVPTTGEDPSSSSSSSSSTLVIRVCDMVDNLDGNGLDVAHILVYMEHEETTSTTTTPPPTCSSLTSLIPTNDQGQEDNDNETTTTNIVPECVVDTDCDDNDICTKDECRLLQSTTTTATCIYAPHVPDECKTSTTNRCHVATCSDNACGEPIELTCNDHVFVSNCLATGTCNPQTGHCDYVPVDPTCPVATTANNNNNNDGSTGVDQDVDDTPTTPEDEVVVVLPVCGDGVCTEGESLLWSVRCWEPKGTNVLLWWLNGTYVSETTEHVKSCRDHMLLHTCAVLSLIMT